MLRQAKFFIIFIAIYCKLKAQTLHKWVIGAQTKGIRFVDKCGVSLLLCLVMVRHLGLWMFLSEGRSFESQFRQFILFFTGSIPKSRWSGICATG